VWGATANIDKILYELSAMFTKITFLVIKVGVPTAQD